MILANVFSNPFFHSINNPNHSIEELKSNNEEIGHAHDKFQLALSIAKLHNWNELIMDTLVKPHAVKYGEVLKKESGDGKLLKQFLRLSNERFQEKYGNTDPAADDDFLYTDRGLYHRYLLLKTDVLKEKNHFLEYASLFDQEYGTSLYDSLKMHSSEELQGYFK